MSVRGRAAPVKRRSANVSTREERTSLCELLRAHTNSVPVRPLLYPWGIYYRNTPRNAALARCYQTAKIADPPHEAGATLVDRKNIHQGAVKESEPRALVGCGRQHVAPKACGSVRTGASNEGIGQPLQSERASGEMPSSATAVGPEEVNPLRFSYVRAHSSNVDVRYSFLPGRRIFQVVVTYCPEVVRFSSTESPWIVADSRRR